MTHKRLQKRATRRMLAKVHIQSNDFHAFVQDLSKSGLGLTCNQDVEVGHPVSVFLTAPEMEGRELNGMLVRKRDLPIISQHKYLLGIRLTDPPEDYVRFVDITLRSEYKRREFTRFEDVLEVTVKDILGLMNAQTENVSVKGLFIKTAGPLDVGSEYDVAFTGKAMDKTLNCLVEIVTSFDCCNNGESRYPFGAGVKIISFAGEDDKYCLDYLKNVEDLNWYHSPEEIRQKTQSTN